MKLFNMIKYIVKLVQVRKIGMKIPRDNRYEFERDLLVLLKKYNIYNKKMSIQTLEIKASVDEIPTIKMETIILPKSKEMPNGK